MDVLGRHRAAGGRVEIERPRGATTILITGVTFDPRTGERRDWKSEISSHVDADELGQDHFEVRKYVSLQRHLILTCVSHLFLAEFRQEHGKKNLDLTVAQLRTATRALVAIWYSGGRCSRKRAESVAAQLTLTQQRNAASRRSHRNRTLRNLHRIGIILRNIRTCQWPRK